MARPKKAKIAESKPIAIERVKIDLDATETEYREAAEIIGMIESEQVATRLAAALNATLVGSDEHSVTLRKNGSDACVNISRGYHYAEQAFRNIGF